MTEAKVFHSIISVPIHLRNKPYELHKYIWRAFVDLPEGVPQPFTFRAIDAIEKQACFLVQSKLAPNWKIVSEITLLRPVTEHIFELQIGESYLYRIVAAPLVKTVSGRKKHSRHVSLQSNEEIWNWFVKRSMNGGIEIDKYRCRFVSEKRNFRHPSQGGFWMTHACFEGLLTITDSEKVKHSLENGFSSKKAFGFGMLNLMNPDQV